MTCIPAVMLPKKVFLKWSKPTTCLVLNNFLVHFTKLNPNCDFLFVCIFLYIAICVTVVGGLEPECKKTGGAQKLNLVKTLKYVQIEWQTKTQKTAPVFRLYLFTNVKFTTLQRWAKTQISDHGKMALPLPW